MKSCFVAGLLLLAAPVFCQTAKPLVIASIPDVGAITREVGGDAIELQVIMPPGTDAHDFNISASDVRGLQNAKLAVFANSDDLGFEKNIKAALGKTPTLDWPDYVAQGASLRDYPDYPKNPHGPWLRIDNARAMARAIAPKLEAIGLECAVVQSNLHNFERELDALQALYRRIAKESGIAGRPVLAVVPGVCDLIANLDVPVGGVLMAEGTGTVGGTVLDNAVRKLKSGEYSGIVCPLNVKLAKQGEAARQVAADSGAHIAWVRFLDTDLQHETYLSVSAYSAAAIAALGVVAPVPSPAQTAAPRTAMVPCRWLWLVIIMAAIVIAGLLGALHSAHRNRVLTGAGIFDQKQPPQEGPGG